MSNSAFLRDVSDPHGVCVERLVAALKTSNSELAIVAGLSLGTLAKAAPGGSAATQRRLLEMCRIIDRIIPWTGSVMTAYAWYRSQALPSFGDATAEEAVRQGDGHQVQRYLDRIAAGGFC